MAQFNQNQWIERDDNQPGYIYLIEAIGVNGWLPGCVVKRYKIGLSRNPEGRLQTFHANQPPVDMRIVRTIYVDDMATIEAIFHKTFKHCNVKLKKSKEFFDLNPVDLVRVHWMFNQYDSKRNHSISPRVIAGAMVALLGIGLLIGSSMKERTTPELQPQNDVIHQ